MCVVFLLCLSGSWTGVLGNPGRPAIPDDPNAAKIFQVAEQQRTTAPDGFLSVEEMAEIFKNFDMNGDQCIDLAEFVSHWKSLHLGDLDAAVTLFHHADTDRDGCIEKDHLTLRK